MWKDKTTWGMETVSGFEFSISREVCVCTQLNWKEKWKYFFPSVFLFFVNILITSVFNWILCSFLQWKGIYLSMRRWGKLFFNDKLPVSKTLSFPMWKEQPELEKVNVVNLDHDIPLPIDHLSQFQPANEKVHPWDVLWHNFPHLHPLPSLSPALEKETAVLECICKPLSSWQRGMVDSISDKHENTACFLL